MHAFGASAPLKALQQEFGFTVDHVVMAARDALEDSVRPGAIHRPWQDRS